MTCVLPLIVMLGSYLTIRVVIYRRSKMFNMEKERVSRTSSEGLIGKAKIKTVKITGILVLGFVLCWAPYNAMFVW
jgi:gonadotropin-releasing hormone receptor